MNVRLRYAPSPTGHLHIGGARTALFNYLFAKHAGGTFILRIEDTDIERNVDRAAEEFAANLRWLGISWDEGAFVGGDYGPYVCTKRLDIYKEYVEKLLAQGLAYRCYCSAEELQQERETQLQTGSMVQYSGSCSHLTEEQRRAFEDEGRTPVIRFRVPSHTVSFNDMIRGTLSFESSSVGGDFVIVKSNGIPAYNFACTVDDHLMQISHVIRGEEHISNTPRQLYIYEAFGWEPPIFGHVSLILGEDGKKLSKRDESIVQFIEQYREMGYLPDALFNFLALLGWSPGGKEEILTKQQLIESFEFDRVSKSGAFFDSVRLAWMNGHYLKEMSAEDLSVLVEPYIRSYVEGKEWFTKEWLIEFTSLFKDKITCLSEIPAIGLMFLVDQVAPDEEAKSSLSLPHVADLLQVFIEQARVVDEWTPDGMKALVKAVQTASNVKGKDLFMPLRAAITGQLHGPDLNRSLVLLGKERVIKRAQTTLAQFIHIE